MQSKTIRQFEILDKIGEGGMGEVYRARDTQLQRTVAIKILPALKGSDADKSRFVREAKSASALNHPNIITVHDAALENGTYFIVMEYVPGKPLSELILRRSMRLQDILKVAIQVADALSCAHAIRIIHRDLKPANIMVREDGLVKVLDFGLAKLIEDDPTAELESSGITAVTEEGTILGTLNYMSPEQLESGKVDARSDIFSFGIVLFEMLTGRSAFQRESRLSTMSAILREQPKWPEDQTAELPTELKRIVNRCLLKDPDLRYQAIKEVKTALEETSEKSESGRLPQTPPPPPRRNRYPILVTTLAAILAFSGLAAWRIFQREPEQLSLKLRALTDDEGTTRFPAISPDGKLVAYSSNRAGDAGLDIWVQQLAPGARPIRLTRDPADELTPTFSPDGSQIAFSSLKDGGGLYVMPALGGEQRLLARGWAFASPRYSPDGKWLAAAPNALVIAASGGSPRRLVEGAALLWSPVWSPDGKHILFAGTVGQSEPDWWVAPAQGGTPVGLGFQKIGASLAGPREWIGEYILFSDGDIKRLRIHSGPWRVSGPVDSLTSSPGVQMEPRAIPHPTRPGRSMVVFASGVQRSSLWELPIDHNQGIPASSGGRRLPADHSDRHTPSLSGDGKRLSYVRRGLEGFEIHARELDTGLDRILTRVDTLPRARLSPDGSTIAINPRGVLDDEKTIRLISWATGEITTLCDSCGLIYDWSPDGKRILYRSGKPMHFFDIAIGTGSQRVIALDSKHPLGAAVLSRDERWMAIHYAVTENIRAIYIAPVRDGSAAPREQWIAVMDRPGVHVRPWWSPNGQILYFLSDAGGKVNVWAQRLTPGDKKPVGKPFVIYSPPEGRFTVSAGSAFGPAVGPASLIFQIVETNTNIWLGE